MTNVTNVTPTKTDNQRDERDENRDGVTHTTLPLERKIGRKRAASRKNTSLPDGFQLTDRMTAHAASKGLDPTRIDHQFERFCDHHRAKGSLFADWEAAWRKWVGNALDYARKNGSGGQSAGYKWNGIEGVT